MHVNKEIEDIWNLEINVDEDVLNVHFWNFKPNEVENIKIASWRQSCHSDIWDVNVFNSWGKKISIWLSIDDWSEIDPKYLVDVFFEFMLQVTKKNGDLYSPAK